MGREVAAKNETFGREREKKEKTFFGQKRLGAGVKAGAGTGMLGAGAVGDEGWGLVR